MEANQDEKVSDESSGRTNSLEQLGRMSSPADRAIDNYFTWLRIKDGQDVIEHHGSMLAFRGTSLATESHRTNTSVKTRYTLKATDRYKELTLARYRSF